MCKWKETMYYKNYKNYVQKIEHSNAIFTPRHESHAKYLRRNPLELLMQDHRVYSPQQIELPTLNEGKRLPLHG